MWSPGRGQFLPKRHNLNNFGRGPLDNVIYQKALGLVVSDKKIFENCLLRTYVWPRDLLMQATGTVWTTLAEKHLGIIPVRIGQNPMSGFKREDI